MKQEPGHLKKGRKLSSFSVILVMVVFMIIGIAVLPLLNVRYAPSLKNRTLQLNFSWSGSSVRVVEQEVTSRLEGVFMRLPEVERVESATGKGWGYVKVRLKKGVDKDVLQFEASTLIRQLYSSFPEGVSYPSFTGTVSGGETATLMTYHIFGNLSAERISQYTEQFIMPVLSVIEGVNNVDMYGIPEHEWEVRVRLGVCYALGVSMADIRQALSDYSREDILGMTGGKDALEGNITVVLRNGAMAGETGETARQLEELLITQAGGRWIRLGDVADISYKEKKPEKYYRVNGQNNVTLRIVADRHVNTLRLCKKIRETMTQLESEMPPAYRMYPAYDQSVQVQKQLNQIYLRSGLSILILMLFVYLTSRKWRYVFLILVTMVANICMAFIFYYVFGVEINIYSMAGITISLGLIIDTSIIMIDHYNYYHNKKAFLAVLGALLTTIGTIVIVFFLPESQRVFLVDFAAVIIINLTVSLFISLFFIPALSDRIPVSVSEKEHTVSGLRRKVRFSRYYTGLIIFLRRRKWVVILLLILMFGLPVDQLPDQIVARSDEEELRDWENWYNATIGSEFYQDKLKSVLKTALGGSLRLFTSKVYRPDFYTEPQRTVLNIQAWLAEGHSVQQLNEVMKRVEGVLAGYRDVIDRYETQVNSYRDGKIQVTFREEVENSIYPMEIHEEVNRLASTIGGVSWNIYGVGEAFQQQQQQSADIRMNRVKLTGYDYERLQAYAERLLDSCLTNKRFQNLVIISRDHIQSNPSSEHQLSLDEERLQYYQSGVLDYYTSLQEILYDRQIKYLPMGSTTLPLRLITDKKEQFDLWHLKNEQLPVRNKTVKVAETGQIESKSSGNDIYRVNQEYNLYLACNYYGDTRLVERTLKKFIKSLSLPLGFKAEILPPYRFGERLPERMPYELLILVVIIIYFICAMLFESFWQPWVIISLIPVSFIGVFLTFYLFKIHFDQGGFASFILLAGLVVNAGIYIINEYNIIRRTSRKSALAIYIQAFNHKIVPISLTIFSTVLGLVPFVWIGAHEVFWYAFAAGTMGGMCFSVIALLLCLPVFMKFPDKSRGMV